MRKCSRCTFFYLHPDERARQQATFTTETSQEPSTETVEMLKKKYPKDDHPRRDLYATYAKAAIKKYGTSVSALNVGASGGYFHYELEKLGADPNNFVVNEIDKRYIQLTEDFFNYPLAITNIEEYQPDRQFDLVTMFDVLEHIDDFWSTLDIIYKCLKPGGQLILKLPNQRFAFSKYKFAAITGQSDKIPTYLYLEPGGHLNYWNTKSIKHLEQSGLQLVSSETLRPTKQQFKQQYLPRITAYHLDRLLHTNAFPEFISVFEKPGR